jgi:hypothetical protein
MQQDILMNDPPRIRSDYFHEILQVAFGREEKSLKPETTALNNSARTPKVASAKFRPIEGQRVSVIIDVDFFDRIQSRSFQLV